MKFSSDAESGTFSNILVLAPLSSADLILSTAMAHVLKKNFPVAQITYWMDPLLADLMLSFCPSIDNVVEFDIAMPLAEKMRVMDTYSPDLFIDLSKQFEGKLVSLFSKTKVLRLPKRPSGLHVLDDYFGCLHDLSLTYPKRLFPTIFPAENLHQKVNQKIFGQEKFPDVPVVALIPGVDWRQGNRGWMEEGWRYLLNHLIEQDKYVPVIIGWEEDMRLCARITDGNETKCINMAGQLEATEIAAFLEECRFAIACDSDLMHLCGAVGTRVVALYGPSDPKTHGPYGDQELVISQHDHCSCQNLIACDRTKENNPGDCMHRIMLPEVIERLAFADI